MWKLQANTEFIIILNNDSNHMYHARCMYLKNTCFDRNILLAEMYSINILRIAIIYQNNAFSEISVAFYHLLETLLYWFCYFVKESMQVNDHNLYVIKSMDKWKWTELTNWVISNTLTDTKMLFDVTSLTVMFK